MNSCKRYDYFDIFEEGSVIKNPFFRKNLVAKVKPKYGLGNYIAYDTGSGIAFFLSNFKLNENKILIEKSEVPAAVLIFNLGSTYTFTFEDDTSFELKKDSYFLGFCSDKFTVDVNIQKNNEYNILTFGIKEELFIKLAHNLKILNEKIEEVKKKNYAIVEGSQIDPEQKETLLAFNKKDLNDYLLTDLNLESKTISLIHYTIKKIVDNINCDYKIDKNILKSLDKAKQIITSKYNTNLSIKEIAYKSAINQSYLKKEFKLYFGMTVYEMIQKQRLDESRKFLKDGLSVKETALKVGYKHSGNFSKLFSEKFGLSPSIYRKQFIWFFLLDIFSFLRHYFSFLDSNILIITIIIDIIHSILKE